MKKWMIDFYLDLVPPGFIAGITGFVLFGILMFINSKTDKFDLLEGRKLELIILVVIILVFVISYVLMK